MYSEYLTTLQKRLLQAFQEIETGYNFDYGDEFEIALLETLRNLIPNRFGVTRGYAIAPDGTMAQA